MRITTVDVERDDHTGMDVHIIDAGRISPIGDAGITYCGTRIANDDAWLVVRDRPVTAARQVNCFGCRVGITQTVTELLTALGEYDAAANLP